MSYCVNCGVELGISLKACPLCDTPVVNPHVETISNDTFFPSKSGEIEPVSKTELAILISSMLLSVLFYLEYLISFLIEKSFGRSMLLGRWPCFGLVCLASAYKKNLWSRFSINLIAVAAYLGFIAIFKDGMELLLKSYYSAHFSPICNSFCYFFDNIFKTQIDTSADFDLSLRRRCLLHSL